VPTNKLLYVGILVVAASALLWVGVQVGKLLEWFLPWAAGAGIVMIVVALVTESRKAARPGPPPPPSTNPPEDGT